MITNYKSILAKAKELRENLIKESENEKKTIEDLVSRMKTTHKLTSLSIIFEELKSYEPKIPNILDPATSGFSSDCYEDDETMKRLSSLSYTEVKNLLFDTSVIKIFPKGNSIREGINVLLMIRNIKLDIDFFKFKEFLLSLRAPPLFLKVKFFFYEGDYSLLLHFARSDQVSFFITNFFIIGKNFLLFSY